MSDYCSIHSRSLDVPVRVQALRYIAAYGAQAADRAKADEFCQAYGQRVHDAIVTIQAIDARRSERTQM